MAEAIKVCVTGAAGQIAYSLLYSLANGDVFGTHQPLVLTLLDITPMLGVLHGVVMEMQDCALPLVKEVVATDSEETAFRDVDVAILVGAMPRREGMERKDLLKANVKIFKSQGQALDKYAKKSVKVLVVGNPANTNAFIASQFAPSIPKSNFTCMTRLDQNRAQAQIANRLGISTSDVNNIIIWGNHSSTQFPDISHATAKVNGNVVSICQAVNDDNYLKHEFIKIVQTRGAEVIKARKLSSAMSAAKAICDHMRDWWFGSDGRWVSMGIVSNGDYGIPVNLVYSFPLVVSSDGKYQVVDGLNIGDFAREKMDATAKELIEERDLALSTCEN